MRILIISDTHGMQRNLELVLERVAPIDMVLHLGDVEGCEEEIAQMAGCPLEVVAGNNDFFTSLEREKILILGKYRVLLTHGHYYYVNAGIEDIRKEAAERNCDIVMFGHTHKPLIDYGEDVIVLNPGSLSYPRQAGYRYSYIMMNIDQKGEAQFSIEYL